jgi:hypothetical protein
MKFHTTIEHKGAYTEIVTDRDNCECGRLADIHAAKVELAILDAGHQQRAREIMSRYRQLACEINDENEALYIRECIADAVEQKAAAEEVQKILDSSMTARHKP